MLHEVCAKGCGTDLMQRSCNERSFFYADRKDKTPAYKSHQCLAGSPDDRDLPAVDAVSGIGRQ